MFLQPPMKRGSSEHSWLEHFLWGINHMNLLRWAAMELGSEAPRSLLHGRDELLTEHLRTASHSHRTAMSCCGLARMLAWGHCCKSRQVSTVHQCFPEEMSPPDFLGGELNSPAFPNQVLDSSFFKKRNTTFYWNCVFLSGNSKGNLPTSSA